jgi:3-oxoacyl-[acyl-carrier-protein] synthase II
LEVRLKRRVVITGMGWVTPLGHDVPSVWERLLRGENAIGPITRFDASTWATNFAAEVRNFRLEDFIPDTRRHKAAGISTHFALAAASQAWKQAGMDKPGMVKPRRIGVYVGAGEGSLDYRPFCATNLLGWKPETKTVDGVAWATAGAALMDRRSELEQEPNAALTHLTSAFACRGPSSNCMTACAASTQAIGEAFEVIRRGDADAMLTGGTHSMIHLLGITGFIRLTAMSSRRESPQTAARPFDQSRDGFVMGEGSGMLILEGLEHAMARGAKPLAEVGGYGSTADAFRITDIQPDGRGAAGAMSQALRQAGINPRETDSKDRPPVHYISAHGTGTQENDKIETTAVKSVFGALAPRVPFSSVKSMFGHLIQAAGAVELITCIQAIRTGMLPPTMNLNTPDPECDLDYIPNAPRDERSRGVEACLSNSFGFGGQNDTILVRRFVP